MGHGCTLVLSKQLVFMAPQAEGSQKLQLFWAPVSQCQGGAGWGWGLQLQLPLHHISTLLSSPLSLLSLLSSFLPHILGLPPCSPSLSLPSRPPPPPPQP